MMSNMSFLDKIKILSDIISSSNIFIIAIIIFIILGFLFATTNKSNYKSSRKVYILMYLGIISIIFITYNSSLSKMFDYMMNNFFIAVYFPNLAIYLAAIIATNIITWVSIFDFKNSKILKVINVVVFCIIHYLLVLILNIITEKNLDVFTQTSIYGNKQVLALIELTSTLFVVWIIFLIVYRLIRNWLVKESQSLSIENKSILNDINKLESPSLVKGTIKKNKPKVQVQTPTIYDNILTLDDYKLLLNILKEQKQRQQEELARNESDEQSKFMELQALYKSIDQ